MFSNILNFLKTLSMSGAILGALFGRLINDELRYQNGAL